MALSRSGDAFRLVPGRPLSPLIGGGARNGPEMGERGLQAEVAALIRAEEPADDGEQLTLAVFDDFASPVEDQAHHRGVAARRPGRPEGSKTRANLNIVRLIKATKRPTLLALKEWADMSLHEFQRATGISDPAAAWSAWFRVAELVTAYEEGRPSQRVELTGEGGAPLPVVVFGDLPVRPDLVDGNAPDDGAMINVTDWTSTVDKDASTNDAEQVEGAWPKAHDLAQAADWQGEPGD